MIKSASSARAASAASYQNNSGRPNRTYTAPMMKSCLIPVVWALAGAAGAAEDCEALRSQIEAKIGAAGVTRFAVITVDANAPASGQVVGNCELGSKKIVYQREAGAAATAVPTRPRSDAILTECKDGSTSVGGDCKAR
jgi:hypothetical protein